MPFCPAMSDKRPADGIGACPVMSQHADSGYTTNEKLAAPPTMHSVTKEQLLSAGFQPVAVQKLIQEAIVHVGTAVAILFQVAHPGVGAGVNEHSNFAYRPMDRLRTTMTFIYCMTFGTAEEKRIIIDLVDKVHSVVNGELQEGKDKSKPYNAYDPELQLWVASTLYACHVDIYEKIFGKSSNALADQIYKEYSVLAVALQVPPELWPKDRQAFGKYWNHMIATLEVTSDARNVVRDLLHTKELPFYLRVFMPQLRVIAAGWLPERMRHEYGLDMGKAQKAQYKFYMAMMKGMYPLTPKFIRTFPLRYYMKDMRKRMKNIDNLIGKQV